MNTPQTALYAGSFNPFHIGHLDILRQGEKIFDKVVIGVGTNGAKGGDIDAAQHSLTQIGLPNLIVNIKSTITSIMKNYGIDTLARGVRNNEDLIAEAHMGCYLRDLLPSINIVYLFPNPEVAHVSSSAIQPVVKSGTGMFASLTRKL